MQKLVTILVLLLTLAGCASTQVVKLEKQAVELGAGLNFKLLEPSSYGKPLSLTQVAEITANQEQHELIFVLQIQANEMTVIGLLPNGVRIFSIYYDGHQIRSEGFSGLLEKLDPKYLIADIQISLWPLKTLKQQWLSRQVCYLRQQCLISESTLAIDGSRLRTIMIGDKKLVSVQFSPTAIKPETIVLSHLERGYQITLEATE